MIARPYQTDGCNRVFAAWKEGNSCLVVMPTGTGKTILFAKVIKRAFPRRAMVIAHRQELIWQAKDKIERAAGLSVEVEMGEHRAGDGGLFRKSAVVVSTIQTLTAGGDGGGRMTKFDPDEFGVLIIDEAHHYVSPSGRRALDWFMSNPKLKVLGVTATPDRADEEALGQAFETVAFDYEILDAIRDGWLVPVDQQMVDVSGLDFSAVRTTAGDLNGADLAAIMESEKNLQGVAGPAIDIVGDRRAIAFTSSVKHAEQLSEIFNRHKRGMSSWLCGKTDTDERAEILSKFSNGDIQIVCNCGVLTEGFDDPGVSVAIMARPTKSRSLYAQMCGRTMRPADDIAAELNDVGGPDERRSLIEQSSKPSCLIVDFVGNAGRHKLMTTADVLGGNITDAAIEAAIARARRPGGKPVRMDEALLEEQQAEQEARRLESEARRNRIVARADYLLTKIDPFDVLQLQPTKARGWESGKKFSEKQSAMLRRNGVDPMKIEFHKGKQLLDAIFERIEHNLCSVGQMKVLKRAGVKTEISFRAASAAIDVLSRNGWRNSADVQRAIDAASGDAPPPRPQRVPEEDNVPF